MVIFFDSTIQPTQSAHFVNFYKKEIMGKPQIYIFGSNRFSYNLINNKNLKIASKCFSSSSPFITMGKMPNDFAEQKHHTKADFSMKSLRFN